MKTNFKEYLEKKKAQKIIDKFAKKYEGKRIVLYGAGLFAGDLIRNYDFSKLNIIGVADKTFQENNDGDFYGYKKFGPYDLLQEDFDLLLITTYDDTSIRDFIENTIMHAKNAKFEVKTLISLNLFEYIKALIKQEV